MPSLTSPHMVQLNIMHEIRLNASFYNYLKYHFVDKCSMQSQAMR